ncbi:hypothetical protein [Chamaesiphon sp.]|uniref:hypothetical protein n=1 Tax=Chamaesiphon sp. TaxID=2814140 RepID=UPI003592F778
MYRSTAAIGSAIQHLRQFPEANRDPILIHAITELETARSILVHRWQIRSSIHWNSSPARIKFSTTQRYNGFVFDANWSLHSGGIALNNFVDLVGIAGDRQERWCDIIKSLNFASSWLNRDFGNEATFKQLTLAINLN